MKRKAILLSSAFLFLVIGTALILIGSGEKGSMMTGLLSASIPFIFISYWNFFSYKLERITSPGDEYFTYGNFLSGGIGISYNKITVVPFFLILFISASLAIVTFFLAVNKTTGDFSIVTLLLSFLLSVLITVYFSIRINKAAHKEYSKRSTGGMNGKLTGKDELENLNDEIGFKIAFFFASLATLGLFPLIYFIIKKVRS